MLFVVCWWWTALARLLRYSPRRQTRQPVSASFNVISLDRTGPQMWAKGYTAEDV